MNIKHNMVQSPPESGLTLVELLIAMVISVIVMSAIYMTFKNQQHSYMVQDNVTAMQQNVRAGTYYMESEIRMAGYNLSGIIPEPTITAATNTGITFTRDDGTGTAVTYSYSFNAANNVLLRTIDSNGDGVNDTAGSDVYDNDGDGLVDEANENGGTPVAEEIEALGFAYAYDSDEDGRMETYTDGTGVNRIIWAVDTNADGNWDNLDTDNDGDIDNTDSIAGTSATAGQSVDASQIRAVMITLLARTDRGDDKYYNNNIYTVANQKITPAADADPNNDNCRMRLLKTIIICRNMGL